VRLLLDTNTCIEILRGRNAGQPRADIVLSAIVRSELLAGALLSAKPDENRRIAEAFCALFPCLAFDKSPTFTPNGMHACAAPGTSSAQET